MREKSNRWFVVGTAAAIVVLWAATVPVLVWWFPNDPQLRGQVGDAFGSINALFSGLALAGVVVAILLQRDELQLQRRELEETRAEMARGAAAQEQARDALLRQHQAMLLSASINAQAARVSARLERAKTNPMAIESWEAFEHEMKRLDDLVRQIGAQHDPIFATGNVTGTASVSGEVVVGPHPAE